MADVLIALGGNVGDVRQTFRKAIANILGMTQAALLARSSDYATPPWGDAQQARFINACIEIETGLDPHALLFTLHRIEAKFGRDRARESALRCADVLLRPPCLDHVERRVPLLEIDIRWRRGGRACFPPPRSRRNASRDRSKAHRSRLGPRTERDRQRRRTERPRAHPGRRYKD